jgi:predicted RNA-binding Zn-ribbon protein involved in translation (DUF1610 family)
MDSALCQMSCPACGLGIEFPVHDLGEIVPCPRCGEDVILFSEEALKHRESSQASGGRRVAHIKLPMVAEQSAEKQPSPVDKSSDQSTPAVLRCRICDKEVSPGAQTCPHCGEHAPAATKKFPKCGSTRVTASEGTQFGFGKAAAGSLVLGPVGLLAGLLPTKSTFFKCLKCGCEFI